MAEQNEAAAVDDTRSTAVRDALSDAVTLSLQSVQYTLVQVGSHCCICPLPLFTPAFGLVGAGSHRKTPELIRQVFGSTAATDMMLALRGALVEPLLVTMPEVVSRMRPEGLVCPLQDSAFRIRYSP